MKYENQEVKLKAKIPYDIDIFGNNSNYEKVISDLLEDSKAILLETLYPFDDFSEKEVPRQYYNWQLRCCVDLYNMADKRGIVNYSENGISWSKLVDGLSNDLMNKLVAHAGVPRSEEGE